jgi:hypothetical protein
MKNDWEVVPMNPKYARTGECRVIRLIMSQKMTLIYLEKFVQAIQRANPPPDDLVVVNIYEEIRPDDLEV